MKVDVNGQSIELVEGASLCALLTQLDQPQEGMALAVNQTIVPQGEWEAYRLHDGDTIALFQAIAGG